MEYAAGHETLMRLAIDLAVERMEQNHGGPFGAVVAREGRVIATGFNAVTSLNDPTAHAEVQAIRNACAALKTFQLRDCDVYTSCEPCPMCLGALYWARPRAVYFAATRADATAAGFDDAWIHDEVARGPGPCTLHLIQVLAEEGQRPFAAWLGKPDRVRY